MGFGRDGRKQGVRWFQALEVNPLGSPSIRNLFLLLTIQWNLKQRVILVLQHFFTPGGLQKSGFKWLELFSCEKKRTWLWTSSQSCWLKLPVPMPSACQLLLCGILRSLFPSNCFHLNVHCPLPFLSYYYFASVFCSCKKENILSNICVFLRQ